MGIDRFGTEFSLRLVIYALVVIDVMAAILLIAIASRKSSKLFVFFNKSSRRFKVALAIVNAAAILYFASLIFLGFFPQLIVPAEFGGILMLIIFLFDLIIFLV